MTAFYSRKTFPWWLCLRLTVVTITAAAETDLKKLGSANNGFALEMYKQISDADGDGRNVFFSPISVTTALAMTYTGARGTTAQQMKQVLNFDDIGSASDVHAAFRQLLKVFNEPEKNYTLSLANRLFGASGYDFLQDFIDLTDTYYDAPMTSLDFVLEPDISREHINDWVENKTEGKIQDILEQGTIIPSTVLVLVNAIYFKGKWAVPFDPEHTVIGDFHISEGSTVKTDMMTMSDTEFLYGESADLNAKILRLPYGGEEVSMFILLPNSVTGLSSVEEKLSLDGLNSALENLGRVEVETVKIPKFELTQLVNMKQLLMNLGMVDLFKAEADLSGMNGIGGLMVSEVVHKAFVNVNEEGAEAAAATAVIVVESASLDPITFIANKPFLFFIWEQDSGSILFMGRFAAPPTGEARAVGVFGETLDRSSAAEWQNMATLLVTSLCLAVCVIMH